MRSYVYASVCAFTPGLANFYVLFFNFHYQLVSRFTDVHFNMVCMNVHVLNIP